MNQRQASALLAVFTAAAGGCYAPPARSTGPSESGAVRVELAQQFCEESDDPDWVGDELVQLRMRIEVANRGTGPITLEPKETRLRAPDGIVVAEPVGADGTVVVEAGETKTFAVRFLSRGSLSCSHEMTLEVARSVEAGGAGYLSPIAFVARGKASR